MSEEKKNKGYRDTLNLPKTSFDMKANLVQREPQMRKAWEKDDIYNKIRQARKDSPLYTLHDGPPYANGDIHMGHVINKVLKDFVLKYKTRPVLILLMCPAGIVTACLSKSKLWLNLVIKRRKCPNRKCVNFARNTQANMSNFNRSNLSHLVFSAILKIRI